MRKPLPTLDIAQLLARNARRFGTAVMTMPNTPPPAPANTPPGDPGTPPATPPRTFTQEELSSRAAAEKEQGRRAGEAALLQTLGVTDAAEAQRIITAAKEAERNAMTEAQRAQADAQQAAAEAAADRAAAAQERHLAKLERALGTAGAQAPDRAARMLYDVPATADEATLAAAVEKLKTDMPGLFGATPPPAVDPANPTTPPANTPPGDPGTPPPPPAAARTPAGDFGAKGREEAAKRFTPKAS